MAEYEAATGRLLTDRFLRAFQVASEIHAAQVRKGTRNPYLAHLLSVTALVLEYGGGEDAAIAALPHDAVEDSQDGTQTEAVIRQEFGDHVANVVVACSDAVAAPERPKAPWRERKTRYLEHLAAEGDPDVLLVSACDKLHNARSILADLLVVGPALWGRFSEPRPAAQLWYYKSLAACYRDRGPAGLSDELNRVIAQIQALPATT